MNNEILDRIIEFADRAHGDQMRKYAPERYIVHPVKVMKLCARQTDDLCILGAAILHDVLEDTPTTAQEIETMLNPLMSREQVARTLLLVKELTDVYTKEAYPGLNRKERKERETERLAHVSADAQTIKYADIIDNSTEIVKHDRHFAHIFLHECKTILDRLDKGDPQLYEQAKQVVSLGIADLKHLLL